jgi:hypothetical protein
VESCVIASGKYRIIIRDELSWVFAQGQIPVDAFTAPENSAKLRGEHIEYLITGSVDVLERDYAVTLRLFDAGSSHFYYSVNGFMRGSSRGLYDGINTLAARFIDGIMRRKAGMPARTPPRVKSPERSREPGPSLPARETKRGASASRSKAQSVAATQPAPRPDNDPVYQIGDLGPGEGFIFFAEGNSYMEVSPILGEYNWNDAIRVAQEYNGGHCKDWRLPSRSGLNRVYENLHKRQIVNLGNVWFWTSSQHYFYDAWYQSFQDGYQDYCPKTDLYSVRLIRAFYIGAAK